MATHRLLTVVNAYRISELRFRVDLDQSGPRRAAACDDPAVTGGQIPPPREAPHAGSTQAMFDRHYAGVLASEAQERRDTVDARGGPSGVLIHDPDGAHEALRLLDEALYELELGLRRADPQQRNQDAIGIDPVSIQLRTNIDEMYRRGYEYLRVWTEQVRSTRDALRAQVESYAQVEKTIVDRLS